MREGKLANEIFISYRRSDDPSFAGRLYDHLEAEFPSEVFMDVASIQPGHSFDEAIQRHVESSNVVLAVIGSRWMDLGARLASPDDYVRRELKIALTKKNRVIPILSENASELNASRLPEDLKELAFCQRLRVSHERFRVDTAEVIKAVRNRLREAAKETKRTWDRTSFLNAAKTERGAELEGRLIAMLEWAASAGHALRWGSGAKYGSAQIIPKGASATAISFDTSGMAYVYMNELERVGVFRSAADREAFVDRLNTVQGIAIKRERAGNAFVGFKIGNVDREDIEKLLRVIDAELEKRGS